jgi:hypothetical protein
MCITFERHEWGIEMRRYRRLIVGLCALGLVVALAYVSYLAFSYLNRNPRVERVFDFLCPPSNLTAWYIDAPNASTAQYGVLWVVIALINAGLYGAVGVFFVKLGQFIRRKNPSRS